MVCDNLLDFADRVICQSSILCQFDRIKPELTLAIGRSHMNVRGLATFVRIEVKAIWADAANGGNFASLTAIHS
jgi:hypothetical protein